MSGDVVNARTGVGAAAGAPALEVLTLSLGGETFALEAASVREILDLVPVTEVPNARPFVGGLINVRGKVVPLADLRLLFDMAPAPPTIDTRIVVVEADLGGDATLVGILADKVHEVTEIAAAALAETPRIGMRWRPEYIRGIGKHGDSFVVVLNLERVLTGPSRPPAPPAAQSLPLS
ncbi:chemotaxis protein CheW [Azospirillum sp. A39]|uniref:chemotaxis protein CheW n=1 Tax=Azospirillum sp. A39 TaxID=3462279 RepID=UPI0040459E77